MGSRRRFIGAAGATATVAFAGCSSITGPGNSPGDAVTALYEAINDGDQGAVEDALHSQSPSDPSAVTNSIGEAAEISVQNTSVPTEGPSESQIRDAVGDNWNDDELQQIVDAATGANNSAVVEAEVEFSGGGQSATSSQTFVVATEDGSYKVLG